MGDRWWSRLADESAQALAIVLKDVRVYYFQPPMIMFGLLMPFFIFFSFSVKRGLGVQCSMASLLALTTFFTASSAGPVILPLERRERTYDRLLTAPMSLSTLLLAKALVGTFFGVATSLLALLIGVVFLRLRVSHAPLLTLALLLNTAAFSGLGLAFASLPGQSVGSIMMPSTPIRWPLLFISGVFIPLSEMAPWARAVSYLSPLTYGQDLMHHALDRQGVQHPALDVAVLALAVVAFLLLAGYLHRVSRRAGS
ncbi:MAG: ABC transporter permease [Anaerolineae bacterium]|nr:ABC transporter permease [Anaerolineae bacterium]